MKAALVPRLYAALGVKDPFARLMTEVCPGVYVFDAFTKDFCRKLLAQVERHEPEAPNSMNKYGLVLRDAGYGRLCEHLLESVVKPLTRRFYPGVGELRKYHGFIVSYDPEKQGSLDLHEDSSSVTLNVCLGRKFTGGKLLFYDDGGEEVACIGHKVGQAVLHLGERQHEAKPIRSGTRTNLILWCSE